jgi:hypothetical protein
MQVAECLGCWEIWPAPPCDVAPVGNPYDAELSAKHRFDNFIGTRLRRQRRGRPSAPARTGFAPCCHYSGRN